MGTRFQLRSDAKVHVHEFCDNFAGTDGGDVDDGNGDGGDDDDIGDNCGTEVGEVGSMGDLRSRILWTLDCRKSNSASKSFCEGINKSGKDGFVDDSDDFNDGDVLTTCYFVKL